MKAHFNFNVLIDQQEGSYVAHCLEMGLVAVSDNCNDLPEIMSKLISRQIDFALKNNNPSDIFHPAPAEVWEKFRRATRSRSNKWRARTRTERGVRSWPGLEVKQSYASAHC